MLPSVLRSYLRAFASDLVKIVHLCIFFHIKYNRRRFRSGSVSLKAVLMTSFLNLKSSGIRSANSCVKNVLEECLKLLMNQNDARFFHHLLNQIVSYFIMIYNLFDQSSIADVNIKFLRTCFGL